jgi:tetratricopeptide (TPR) repeat protein
MLPRAAKKLLIIGWDAADWKIIDPLLARGEMPALAGLLRRGVRADLATLSPRLSPILWTSIATGKTADKHRILNFVEPDPNSPAAGALRLSSCTTRRARALWNILTAAGLRTNVVSWYASHPAEPIRGVCISNLFQEGAPRASGEMWPVPPGSVHPHSLALQIAALRRHPAERRFDELLAMLPALPSIPTAEPRVSLLAKLMARSASVHAAACALLARDPSWDCTMVFDDLIDVVGHHFMQYYPPRMPHVFQREFQLFRHVVAGAYRLQDRQLGAILDAAGDQVTVILLSDHGFHSDHLRPAVPPSLGDEHAAMDATWHRPLGVLAMAGPGIRAGAPVAGVTLLDIAPTALNLLGLPAGADMDGRTITEAVVLPARPDPIPSWDSVDGDAGLHPPDLRQDPFEAREALAQLVDLGYLSPATQDQEEALELVRRETQFNLATVYLTTNRVSLALPIFEELASVKPDEPRYALSLAQCYSDRGRSPEARATLESFLGLQPGHRDARIALAGVLFAESRFAEAQALLEAIDRELPGPLHSPELDCLIGTNLVFLRRPDDAAKYFSRAAATDPHSPQAHHGLALADLCRERFEDGAEHCLKALELLPAYPDAHYTLGVCLAWLGDFRHALQSFQLAVSLQPGLIEAHRFMAAVHRAVGEDGPAAEHKRMADRLTESRPAMHGGLEFSAAQPPMGSAEWLNRRSDAGS